MKFCFFGNISDALKGSTLGGAELQIALIAKALALKGHEVVIIDPYSVESFVTDEGIRLINIPDWNKGLRGIRLFCYRIPALKKIFLEQKADFYYARMRTYFHLLSYKVAKQLKGKFILAIAHDIDILGIRNKIRYTYSRNFNLFKFITLDLPNDLVFKFLIKRADYITVQHSGQIIDPTSIRGKIISFPNIIDESNWPIIKNPTKDYFIHVGTLTILKGTRNLYKLMNILKEDSSVIIVGEPRDNRSKKILKTMKGNKNIIFKGRLNHHDTLQLIGNARALINTSNYEGFPNIFLEAWASGVPVISLKVNPGNILNKHDLGVYCGGDLNRMRECIELNETVSIDNKNLISYVSKFHSFDTAADRFLNSLNNAS